MALLIGQAIDARELEQVISGWSPERFASMCNILSWAVSGRMFRHLPDFTERVNAKDGGIDAGWSVDSESDGIPTPILGPGWNVFQYKQRSLLAQDRRRIISGLKSNLKGAIKELAREFGRTPDRYTLFVNVDLKSTDKAVLKEKILNGYQQQTELHVEIASAAELAAFLNDHPHIRAAYFAPLTFSTWKEAYEAHRVKKLFGANVDLIGRATELEKLKSLIDDAQVKAIVVKGPHDIGKSRLALEATRHRSPSVVLTLAPDSMAPSDYRLLCTDRKEVICIVDDPDSKRVNSLIDEALVLPTLKMIITLPAPSGGTDELYGLDERIQTLPVDRLSDEGARALLKATGKAFDYGIQDWILTYAVGVPGVLLAAASIGSDLRRDVNNFSKAVGKEFERKVAEALGESPRKTVALFSVLEHVGVSGNVQLELQAICRFLENAWSAHDALSCLPTLEMAGLIRRKGDYVEVVLPLLANYLVGELLRGRRSEMFALFAELSDAGRIRFIKRLAQIKQSDGDEVEQFWDEIFGHGSPLGSFKDVLKRSHLLRLIAGTTPERTLRVLEAGLLTSSIEDRLAISGDQRRELMWALEQLLFRSKTSRGALRLLWLLAEAENETYGNNATGVLEKCFHPLHPQMPLTLDERLALLRELALGNESVEAKRIAIKAIQGALGRSHSVSLHRSSGPEPLDTCPDLTYGDIFRYCRQCVGLVMELAEQADGASEAALQVLPALVADVAAQGSPRTAVKYFHTLRDWAGAGRSGLDVSKLSRSMNNARERIVQQLVSPHLEDERRKEIQTSITELAALQSELESAGFGVRLKRWTGPDSYHVTSEWSGVESALRGLSSEAVVDPSLLSPDLLEWLLIASAKESLAFFYFLGENDKNLTFLPRIEELGKEEGREASAFSSYFAGWAKRDLSAAERRLEELASSNAISGTAILETTGRLDSSSAGLARVKHQIRIGRAEPEYGAAILRRWLDRLMPEDFEEILMLIAGDNFSHTSAAVDLLGAWRYHKRPLSLELQTFAWRCIESGPSSGKFPAHAWQFDDLASQLTQESPNLGFQMLERLLVKGIQKGRWEPLNMDGGDRWWNTLRNLDKKRLFETLLNASRVNAEVSESLSWRLRDLLDQEDDQEILGPLASMNVEYARIITSWLSGGKPGFWIWTFKLVETFPADEVLRENLSAAVMQMGTWIEGPMSKFYEARKREVEEKLQDPSTPSHARAWLREVVERLGVEISGHVVWEYDRDINDLRRYIEDKDSDQRIWAIGRVLKYADWKDIRQLLSLEDIEEALPIVDLPEKKRRMLNAALSIWRREK